jgi:Carboxypeptidase regulatory-like domain/TonB dependent receptor
MSTSKYPRRRAPWLAGRLAGHLVTVAALAGLAGAASAQETGGAINGTITDAQQAALPGVTVTLRNDATNAILTTVSNEEGSYVLPFVPIGRYTLTAALEGFSTARQGGIEVRVGDRLRIDLGLQIGAMTEEVSVTSAPPLLEVSSAARGQVINRDQVQDLPLLGRNPFMLAQLSTSVQYIPTTASRSNRPFDNGGMDNFSISGGRAFTNEFLLDGVPNSGTETVQPNNLSFVPSPDATGEFKVQTSLYDAQYGRSGGGVINVVLKSGTNQFHGSIYEYYRDEKLNANTFDANRGGIAKAGLYWNQPGLTVDGPVRIPGLYDGRDKTFFMYSWEQIRSEVPFPQVYTVPSALERAGNFSETRTSDGRPITLYDPLTTRLVDGQYVRDPFPGNTIPTTRIDPVAVALLQRVPLPNAPGQVNNFLVPENARADKYDQHVVKVDQVLNERHRFFGRFARNKRTEINDFAGFPPEASPWYQHGRMNVGFSLEGTSVLSPSFVLSSRVGFIRHEFYIATHGDNFDPTALGFPSSLVSQLPRRTFPQVQWEGYSTFGSTFGANTGSIFTTSDTWSWSETFSKTAGNHSVKFGGEYRAMINDQQNPTSNFGRFTFNRAFTQRNPLAAEATSGNAVASLLLGYPADSSSTTVPSNVPINPQLDYRSNYYAVFFQDDWRITPKLTVNLGVRWDYESPIAEAANQQNIGFDANAPNPFQVPGLQLRGGLLFADEQNPLPFKRDLNNIQPRLGAAYQMNAQTVIRGGYAVSYLPTFDTGFNNGFSVTTTLVASVDGGITPVGRLGNPYPNGIDQPVGSSQGLATLVGRGFTFSNPDRTIPYVHQFSIGVQRELPWRLVVDASYVGSRTRGVNVSKGINEITAEQLALGNAMLVQVPNPFQGLLPGTPFNGATVPRQQLERPFPQFASITEDRRSLGTTDYDSFQLSVNKRMARGLQLLVSYTYSKQMEEVAYLNPQDDWGALTRVVAERDAPHRLLVSSTYQLPFFADATGVSGALLGGWQVNAIVVAQSGLPVATNAGAELIGDPSLDNPTLARWFNTCTQTLAGGRQNCANPDEPFAWRVQAPFTLRTLTTRLEQVRTSRPTLVDFSIFKTFTLPAQMRLQVRIESFNLFNTPWFGAPNTNINQAAFGQVTPTQVNDPRNIQLGVRLSF